MPFRASFECLWCGTPHQTTSVDDVEGWAQLCPDCIGRAGENGFLRFRLRAALDARGRARSAAGPARPSGGIAAASRPAAGGGPAGSGQPVATGQSVTSGEPAASGRPAALGDDWYLGRRFAGDPIAAARWAADIDAVTLRIDAMPIHGRIVETDAGGGWWSPLLAGRGELWAHVGSESELEAVRARLVAHGLRAHIHVAAADLARGSADTVFTAFRLGRLDRSARRALLLAVREALRPGGVLVALELAGAEETAALASVTDAAGVPDAVALAAADLAADLARAGFAEATVEPVGRSFIAVLASPGSRDEGPGAGAPG